MRPLVSGEPAVMGTADKAADFMGVKVPCRQLPGSDGYKPSQKKDFGLAHEPV